MSKHDEDLSGLEVFGLIVSTFLAVITIGFLITSFIEIFTEHHLDVNHWYCSKSVAIDHKLPKEELCVEYSLGTAFYKEVK